MIIMITFYFWTFNLFPTKYICIIKNHKIIWERKNNTCCTSIFCRVYLCIFLWVKFSSMYSRPHRCVCFPLLSAAQIVSESAPRWDSRTWRQIVDSIPFPSRSEFRFESNYIFTQQFWQKQRFASNKRKRKHCAKKMSLKFKYNFCHALFISLLLDDCKMNYVNGAYLTHISQYWMFIHVGVTGWHELVSCENLEDTCLSCPVSP